MTLAYLKNTAGLTVPDSELEQIPHPYVELYTHTFARGLQLGIVASMVVAAPISMALRGPRNLSALAQRMVRFGKVGAIVGVPIGPAMTYRMSHSDPEIAIYDRCYRLRYNFNQVRQDRFGVACVAAGAVVGGVPGALFGTLAGIGLATAYNVAVAPSHHRAPKYEEIKALVKQAKEELAMPSTLAVAAPAAEKK